MEITPPSSKHTHTIINLHGRDSNAAEYRIDFSESETSDSRTLQDVFPGVKWVYPTAPQILSKRFDAKMSEWFDMWTTENPYERGEEQTQDLTASAEAIKQLILSEGKEVGTENVTLCGISQGAATALTALMGLEMKIGGFIGFATWLAPHTQTLRPTTNAMKTLVFLAHCSDDAVIGIRYGHALQEHLQDLGMRVTWKIYEGGGHWMNEPKGIDDLVRFLKEIML